MLYKGGQLDPNRYHQTQVCQMLKSPLTKLIQWEVSLKKIKGEATMTSHNCLTMYQQNDFIYNDINQGLPVLNQTW